MPRKRRPASSQAGPGGPGALSERTDLQPGLARAVPQGLGFGERQALDRAQASMPVRPGPQAGAGGPTTPSQVASAPAAPLMPLGAPTARPGEPITAGMGGPSAQPGGLAELFGTLAASASSPDLASLANFAKALGL